MKSVNIIIVLFSLIITQIISKNLRTSTKNSDDKLLFVWKHFRHGARGPYIGINPKNHLDFIGEFWDSVGELTPLGLRMHYLLGYATKKEYSDFLSKTYNPNELYITSTNVNRTLLSVYSFLQGFYDKDSSIDLTEKQIDRINILNSNYTKNISSKVEKLGKKSLEGGINAIPVHIFFSFLLHYIIIPQYHFV